MTRYQGVYGQEGKLYTKSAIDGPSIYSDTLMKVEGVTYRYWHPYRSKPSAMIHKGCHHFPFKSDSNLLYLGAGNGTTASFLADIADDGKLFCVEFSKRACRDLINLADKRDNLFPILGDANHPESYGLMVEPVVNLLYQDISQRNQVEIFLKNLQYFQSIEVGIIMVKARSIDVTKKPGRVFELARKEIERAGHRVLDMVGLEPYIKDHAAICVRRG